MSVKNGFKEGILEGGLIHSLGTNGVAVDIILFINSLLCHRDGKARKNAKTEIISYGTAREFFDSHHLDEILPLELPEGRRLVGLHEKLKLFWYAKGE